MRILNWNAQFASPHGRSGRFAKVKALIASYDPDVICLTEAHPETMPELGHTITSEISGAGKIENRGGRKVVIWSRFGWTDIDKLGSDRLPEGRFISAKTRDESGQEWTFIGVCIPYHAYRNGEKWGERRLKIWEGACRYLDALREDVLPSLTQRERTVILGDFNLQIPAFNYPYEGSAVNQKRKETFAGWQIPTAGEIIDPALDKRFIDHIALAHDIIVNCRDFISRTLDDGIVLSDHNGVCIDVAAL